MAIVPQVSNGLGFGSTEFHVLRSTSAVMAEYLYYFVSSHAFRRGAEHNMTGAVGQRRVPAPYMSGRDIPIPPLNEQRRIVAKVEELFSEFDAGIESLKVARRQLGVYRKALLKHAFEGKLTAAWRGKNADKVESAGELLARTQRERQERHKGRLNDWCRAVNEWQAGESSAIKPRKPAPLKDVLNVTIDEIADVSDLPAEWAWARLGLIFRGVRRVDQERESGQAAKQPPLPTRRERVLESARPR